MQARHMVNTDLVPIRLVKSYLNMCHRQDCAGHIPEELIFVYTLDITILKGIVPYHGIPRKELTTMPMATTRRSR